MKTFDYQIQPFRTWIKIVFADTVTEGLQYLINSCNAKISIDPDEEKFTHAIVGHGLDDKGLNAWYMVFNIKAFNQGILVHECFHAVFMTAEQKGMKVTNDSQEYYSHAIQNMVDFINENI